MRPYVRLAFVASIALALPTFSGLMAQATVRAPDVTVTWNLGPPSPFGGTRFDGEYVAPLNRVYFLGFRTFADATDGSVVYLDVATQTYVDTGVDMPIPISNYGIAALTVPDGRLGLFIFGGRNSTGAIINATQVYFPETNTAMVVNSDPWPGTTPSGCVSLPAMGVAVTQNRAAVLGGASFSSSIPPCVDDNSNQTWIFNPMAPLGSKWSRGPNLNMARGYITPAVLNGRIFAIGGDVNTAGSLFAQKIVEAWKPPAPAWDDAAVADLPGPGCDESQAFAFSTAPSGIVLAGCGQWPNAIPNTAFLDATTNMWSVTSSLNEVRRNHAGTFIPVGTGVRMYILGGYGGPSFIDPIQSSELGNLTASGTGAPGGSLGGAGGVTGQPANH